VQLYGLPSLTVIELVNFGIAVLFALAMIVSPILIIKFTLKRTREIALLTEKSAFYKIWGSFFYEFKYDDDSLAKHYYSIFIVKRVLFIANLMFLWDYPILQLVINALLMIGFSIFMLVVKPYADPILQFVNTFAEFGISFIFCGTSYFLFEDKPHLKEVEYVIFYLTLVIMGAQTLASVIIFFRNLVQIIKAAKERKAKNVDLSGPGNSTNVAREQDPNRPDPHTFFDRKKKKEL